MRKHIFFICILFSLFLAGCSTTVNEQSYPKLKVVNNSSRIIGSVSLTGYSFELLYLKNGQSKTFDLSNGIAGGNDNVVVKVGFTDTTHSTTAGASYAIKDFNDGEVTTVTLTSSGLE